MKRKATRKNSNGKMRGKQTNKQKKESETRMTASVLKQNPTYKRLKERYLLGQNTACVLEIS